ncbi:MAG: hypothetical protein ABGW88_04955 [Leeuwenhoekiella sp.]|uniref:hypothetical protein n=1 Tax=Leeuwenhoekiella sp. TaxID=1977054 RepID=UPI000ECFCCF9|nr:hypothetical protein [Leeuwenhoekiella sp.]|tara:strand:+ start:3707 stop:4645 length:939 start_codon:yes stop_codon:yes gene_type:complete
MIFYDLKSKPEIIENHFNKLKKDFLDQRIKDSKLNGPLILFIKTNLETIIKGTPQELILLNTKFKKHSHYSSSTIVQNKIRKIFDYKKFRNKKDNKYDAYELAQSLDVRTCLYCNRLYTLTVKSGVKINEKHTRPQFDHFIDKGQNPLLSLSIYNLIPSCNICNSTLKGRKKFTLNKYLHPYLDNSYKDYSYSFKPYDLQSILGRNSNLEVKIDILSNDIGVKQKIENTKEVFKLEKIMSGHSEELKDLLLLRSKFSDSYLIQLLKTFQKTGLTRQEAYRILFGVYDKEANYIKRPFSKLKSDILKELKINF